MAQEEQKQRFYSNRFDGFGAIGGFSGRSSSKKIRPKPKKVPQRGLGVAQLEKIRLQEQQKHEKPAIFSSSSSSSPLSPSKSSSYLSLPIPNLIQSNQSSSSASFPSPPPLNLSSSSSIFGPPLPLLNMAVRNSSSIPLANQANSGGSETGLSAITILEQGNALKWQNSCEYYVENENYRVDPGLGFRSNFDFPYEVNPGWPLPELMQRTQPYQSPSPMVNVSSTNSLSSGLNAQIEPPSNQSYFYGNNSTNWADKEEKMVGIKKLSLLSPNNPPGSNFNYNYSSFAIPNMSDDSTTHGNGTTFDKPIFREGQVPSTHMSSFENIKEDEFSGNFLTLASLTSCWTCPSSTNEKSPPTYPLIQNLMAADSESLPLQGGTQSDEKQPFFSFLPPAETKNGQGTNTAVNKCNSGVEERVDLDLKL